MAEVDERFVLNEEVLDELYAWIDQVPLTRPKRNIARDFSDGVLVAEVLAYFHPKLVDLHNYIGANAAGQKKINWHTLNRRVFGKLGIRLNDAMIQDLIDAKAGTIEQVLWDVRQKLQVPKSISTRSVPSRAKTPASVNYSRSSSVGPTNPPKQQTPGDIIIETSLGQDSDSVAPEVKAQNPLPLTNTAVGAHHYHQGYVVPPLGGTAGDESVNHNQAVTGPPAQIIYRGHKMIPLGLLDEKDREIKNLEYTNKNLNVKVHRLETLINVKDQRIEDLTHQLHSLRAIYERVTQQTYDGFS